MRFRPLFASAFAAGLLAAAPSAQTVCDGTYFIASQVDLESFGAQGCTEVTGTLVVRNSADIEDLDELSGLESVGSLTIQNNAVLTDIAGLSSLRSVEQFVSIRDQTGSIDLAPLAALETVGFSLSLDGLPAVDLAAFASLQSVGRLQLSNLPAITSIRGIEAVSIGGIGLQSTPQLSDVGALAGRTELPEGLSIGNAPLITDLSAFSALERVGGVTISESALTSLDGLESLAVIEGGLVLTRNSALASIEALANVRAVESLIVERNGALPDLRGLENLRSVGINLRIRLNASLTNVDALAGVRRVEGSLLAVENNGALVRCGTGLGPVIASRSVPTLSLSGNADGGDCNSAEAVLAAYAASVLADGSLAYGTCPEVLPPGRSACRVEARSTFAGEWGQRFTVFLRVAETGRVAFRGEVKPEAGGAVEQGLRFRTVGADPAAFTLELVAEAGSVAAPSPAAQVLGTLAFRKGGAGLRADAPLSAYPNPAAGSATLSFALAEATDATVVVYDALGRAVARPVRGEVEGAVTAALDVSSLPPGLYVVRLTTASGRAETVRLSVAR